MHLIDVTVVRFMSRFQYTWMWYILLYTIVLQCSIDCGDIDVHLASIRTQRRSMHADILKVNSEPFNAILSSSAQVILISLILMLVILCKE